MIRKLRLWWARRRLKAADKMFERRLLQHRMGYGTYDDLVLPAARRTAAAMEKVDRLQRTPGEPWTR